MDAGADMSARTSHNETSLLLSLQHNLIDIARLLICRGANVNAMIGGNSHGQSCLHIASRNNEAEVVALICDSPNLKPLTLDATNQDGDTALHIAVRNGYAAICQKLLSKGASVKVENNGRQTAVDIALQYDRPHVNKLMGLRVCSPSRA